MSSRYAKIFRGWVEDTFTPCAAVLASEGAQSACALNQLAVAQLLRPFSQIRERLQIRMVGQTSAFNNLEIRYVPASEFELRSVEESEDALEALAGDTKLPTVPKGADFDPKHDVEYETEWLAAAKSEIVAGQRFGQSEMLDQPVCFLYVVSTSDPSPLKSLERLIQSGKMASTFHQQYNCSIPRFYLLLHDVAQSSMTAEEVKATFDKMRRLYATGDHQQTRTFSIRINSRPEDPVAAAAAAGKTPEEIERAARKHRHKVSSLWEGYFSNPGDGEEAPLRAQRLSEEDVRELRTFTVEFAKSGLVSCDVTATARRRCNAHECACTYTMVLSTPQPVPSS